MALPTPEQEYAFVKEEALEIMDEGAEATGTYLKDSYTAYMKLNMQFKQDEDNVILLLETNKAKVNYDNKKKAVKEVQAEKDSMDPAAAQERVAAVKIAEEQIKVQKEERE